MTARIVLGPFGVLFFCITACDVLPERDAKELVGGYCLEVALEHKVYTLRGCQGSRAEGTGDLFRGELEQVGWNTRAIVGSRISMYGDQEWMRLDLETGRVTGPFRNAVMAEHLSNDIALRGITVRKVEDVLE